MRVRLPSPLYSYSGNVAEVVATGATLQAVLADLDRQFPGIRFRMIDEQQTIRPHIRFFANTEPITRLDTELNPNDTLLVVAALSGG